MGTVIAEVEVEQPVVVDTEGGDIVAEIVDSATLKMDDSTEAEDSPLTPVIDTQGFAAVSSTVAALEAAVVSEKPVTDETTLTQNPVDAFESPKVVVSDVITETECDVTKKVIVTEATEEIEIVDIAEEVEVVEDEGEGEVTEECNTPKCDKPVHAAFRYEQTEDNPILIDDKNDFED